MTEQVEHTSMKCPGFAGDLLVWCALGLSLGWWFSGRMPYPVFAFLTVALAATGVVFMLKPEVWQRHD